MADRIRTFFDLEGSKGISAPNYDTQEAQAWARIQQQSQQDAFNRQESIRNRTDKDQAMALLRQDSVRRDDLSRLREQGLTDRHRQTTDANKARTQWSRDQDALNRKAGAQGRERDRQRAEDEYLFDEEERRRGKRERAEGLDDLERRRRDRSRWDREEERKERERGGGPIPRPRGRGSSGGGAGGGGGYGGGAGAPGSRPRGGYAPKKSDQELLEEHERGKAAPKGGGAGGADPGKGDYGLKEKSEARRSQGQKHRNEIRNSIRDLAKYYADIEAGGEYVAKDPEAFEAAVRAILGRAADLAKSNPDLDIWGAFKGLDGRRSGINNLPAGSELRKAWAAAYAQSKKGRSKAQLPETELERRKAARGQGPPPMTDRERRELQDELRRRGYKNIPYPEAPAIPLPEAGAGPASDPASAALKAAYDAANAAQGLREQAQPGPWRYPPGGVQPDQMGPGIPDQGFWGGGQPEPQGPPMRPGGPQQPPMAPPSGAPQQRPELGQGQAQGQGGNPFGMGEGSPPNIEAQDAAQQDRLNQLDPATRSNLELRASQQAGEVARGQSMTGDQVDQIYLDILERLIDQELGPAQATQPPQQQPGPGLAPGFGAEPGAGPAAGPPSVTPPERGTGPGAGPGETETQPWTPGHRDEKGRVIQEGREAEQALQELKEQAWQVMQDRRRLGRESPDPAQIIEEILEDMPELHFKIFGELPRKREDQGMLGDTYDFFAGLFGGGPGAAQANVEQERSDRERLEGAMGRP